MRKRRTREHIISDLSVNHVERYVLRAGHTAQRVLFDYGYDQYVQTFDEDGQLEPDYFLIQIKASEHLTAVEGGRFVVVRVDAGDLEVWATSTFPVVLVAYDASRDAAYWTIPGRSSDGGEAPMRSGQLLSVRVPTAQPVGETAVAEWRRLKNAISRSVVRREERE